jgi:chitinase
MVREYPVAPDRNGNTYDFTSFTAWMESLKASLGGKGLSVTLPSSYWYMQHFDIAHLQKHIDWFNVSIFRVFKNVLTIIQRRSCFMICTALGI